MSYVTDENGVEFYMVTRRATKKFKNLQENPSVSMLIDSREEQKGAQRLQTKALTVTGTFQPIINESESVPIRSRLLEKHPHLREFMDHEDAELLRILEWFPIFSLMG